MPYSLGEFSIYFTNLGPEILNLGHSGEDPSAIRNLFEETASYDFTVIHQDTPCSCHFFHFFSPSWWRAIAATAAIAICCKSEAVIISSCPRAAAKVATVPVKPRSASVCCVNKFWGSWRDTNKKHLLLARAWYAHHPGSNSESLYISSKQM